MTPPARTSRPSVVLVTGLFAAVLLALLAGCTYRDPGYMAGAANESDTDLVIRDRTNKWLLPARSVGFMFATTGDPEAAEPVAFEVLDAATCLPLGEVTAEFWPTARSFIVIDETLEAHVGEKGARVYREQLEAIADCPGAADGWSLWVQNRTTDVYYVRSRNDDEVIVAFISQRGNRLALTGRTDASAIDLLDRDCNVLSTYQRTGFAHFRGTIEDGAMIVVPDARPPRDAPRYGTINRCRT